MSTQPPTNTVTALELLAEAGFEFTVVCEGAGMACRPGEVGRAA